MAAPLNAWWMIPLLPLVAAGIIALLPRTAPRTAQGLAIGSMVGALLLSVAAFLATLQGPHGEAVIQPLNFTWFTVGTEAVRLGVVLDPLAAVMALMVSFVGLLIFVFSAGYMAHDPNRARFFGFLSLFASAMLGLVMANSLLLLFACWEIMGVASYLLIGFWFQRPSAAAAARKAFIVTRIGDLGLFLGLLWLYRETGTLLFHDAGAGCVETAAVTALGSATLAGSLTVAGAISLLLFVGAIGKSGQLPLHVWLPDAMEGPTPVSALIHAATMVAAGVFLMARVHPLMTAGLGGGAGWAPTVVTWVGAATALFAAVVAVGQSDLKRILAYSTISQLGFMFVGLGTGGVGVAMFHLLTHAFFKALLFLGAGSVIHGCDGEQDIRKMGGLRRRMPVTFATYAIGMMALSGVPLFFSGFWSKDEILHSAWEWAGGRGPFVLALSGAVLTAFYMTRQMVEVFWGRARGGDVVDARPAATAHGHGHGGRHGGSATAHESPSVMTLPLLALAAATLLLGWLGTPAWPWLEAYLAGHPAVWDPARLPAALPMMLISTGAVVVGVTLGWLRYGRHPRATAEEPDRIEARWPRCFRALRARLWFDELYQATWVRAHRGLSATSAWTDRFVVGGLVGSVGWISRGAAFLMRGIDEWLVNPLFDAGCDSVRRGGRQLARLQSGEAQRYLSWLALGMVLLTVLVIWGWRSS